MCCIKRLSKKTNVYATKKKPKVRTTLSAVENGRSQREIIFASIFFIFPSNSVRFHHFDEQDKTKTKIEIVET